MQTNKKNKNIIGIIQSFLILILVVLIIFMMIQISRLQGTARVINYAGLVRGATQREVKLEITGNQNDELIKYLDDILLGLRYQDGHYNLVKLNDEEYQGKLKIQSDYWDKLKTEIEAVRNKGYENTDIVNMSEIYFTMADETVSAAESYSEKIAVKIRTIELLSALDMLSLVILVIMQTLKAMQMAMQNRLLEQKAFVDAHTGLPNKNACNELLNKKDIITDSTACIMFDLNNLRIINNQQGHERGDLYINLFAKSLRNGVDENQFVGRCGGDEFIAFFKNVTKEDVKRNLENIKKECAKCSEIPLSYAAGFAYSNDFSKLTMRELFCQADKNMYIDKNQAKINEATEKRDLILRVIQQLKDKGYNFSDCIYCDAKIDAYFTLRASYSFFLAEDGIYSGAVEQILNELFEENKKEEYRHVLQLDYLNECLTKENPVLEISYCHQIKRTKLKGKIIAVYLDSDEKNHLHHFALGFKIYYDTIEMDEKQQLMRYYDQLKQSILENDHYIEALMAMAQSIFSVNLTQNQIDGIYDNYMCADKKLNLPCDYNAYFKQLKANVLVWEALALLNRVKAF